MQNKLWSTIWINECSTLEYNISEKHKQEIFTMKLDRVESQDTSVWTQKIQRINANKLQSTILVKNMNKKYQLTTKPDRIESQASMETKKPREPSQ